MKTTESLLSAPITFSIHLTNPPYPPLFLLLLLQVCVSDPPGPAGEPSEEPGVRWDSGVCGALPDGDPAGGEPLDLWL